jgi:hypothetical protein
MDFRKKLLVISASAMVFAGMASAVTPCPTATNTTGLPNILRLEGTNDLTTALFITCGAATLTSGTVVAQLTGTVTSKAIPFATTSEATLLITTPPGDVTTAYAGTVSGTQVSFGTVAFPAAAFTMSVVDVRINSSLLTAGQYVTEVLNVYNQGVVAFSSATNIAASPGPTPVGYVQGGFSTPAFPFGVGPVQYTLCVGNVDTNSFSIPLTAKFGGAFKTKAPTLNTVTGGALACGPAAGACTSTNGEQGTYIPGGGSVVGVANSGTRFLLSFTGIPTGVTLYLPVSIAGTSALAGVGSSPLTLTLTASATGAFSAVAASTTVGFPGAGVQAAITATNGAATAVYEVTSTDNTVPAESLNFTGAFTFAANFSPVAVGPVTVTITPAPSGSTNVPNFAASSNTAITLSSWSPCVTSLLFPFVTNQLGFDTGIVLANTSTDPFGGVFNAFTNPAGYGAAAAPGACVLNFYGAGAPTPSTGVAAPGGSQASGTTNAFQLSSVAAGFQGYMIAVCNYQYGHGYAFIEYDLTQNNGVAEGYLALILPYSPAVLRSGAAPEALNN